jgi:hypothetical protein
MHDLWASLNQRQRSYLQALYECDQASERDRKERASRGVYDRTPASVWRWQLYGPTQPPSQLYSLLRKAKLVDQGTGATWQALEARGLVLCRNVPDDFGLPLLQVQITPAGRKLVRAATDEQRPKAAPKGQLRPRQWAALSRLYSAGPAGERSDTMLATFDWTRTLLRLRDYRPQALMEEFQQGSEYRIRISAFGRDYYQRQWAHYRQLYPEVEAPEPNGSL